MRGKEGRKGERDGEGEESTVNSPLIEELSSDLVVFLEFDDVI